MRRSSRRTANYNQEALRRWGLAEADEVDEDILVEILGRRNFFHAPCSVEEYPLDVQRASDGMLVRWWHARYFKASRAGNRTGLLLQFQAGIFSRVALHSTAREQLRRRDALVLILQSSTQPIGVARMRRKCCGRVVQGIAHQMFRF